MFITSRSLFFQTNLRCLLGDVNMNVPTLLSSEFEIMWRVWFCVWAMAAGAHRKCPHPSNLPRGGKAKVKSPILLLRRASSSGRELCMNEWIGDVHVTLRLKTDMFPNKAARSLFPVFNFPTLNRFFDLIIISWMHNAPLYLPPYMYAYMWEPSHGPHQAVTFPTPNALPPCS